MSADKLLALGYISAVHGIKGWVKVHSWTRPMEAILDYQPWLLGEDKRSVKIIDGRKQGKGLAALLPGFEDREQAATRPATGPTTRPASMSNASPGTWRGLSPDQTVL